jgi:hypothetical protein
MNRKQIFLGLLALALLPNAPALRAGPLHDDQSISVTAANAASRRHQLISYIWGTDGFPPTSKLPARTHLSGPPSDLTPTGTPLENLAYMPHMHPGACANAGTATDHNTMLSQSVRTGSPLKWFLEPIAVSLNYLRTKSAADGFPHYQEYDFVGLSGGGWTVTVYAAIDPSIKVSIPVAGSIPLYLRSGGSIGDAEQTVDSLFCRTGPPMAGGSTSTASRPRPPFSACRRRAVRRRSSRRTFHSTRDWVPTWTPAAGGWSIR